MTAALTLAPTDGWDLVYAVRLPQVNARIAEQNASPKAFSAAVGTATVSGSFSTWRIVPGGAGYLVYLSIPVDGTVASPGSAALPFAGTIKVSVELNYLPASAGASSQQALQIQQPSAGGTGSSPLFAITEVDFGTGFDTVAQVFIQTALQEWLTANPGVFNHVFAVVNLSAVTAEAPYAWLKPTTLSYAYADAAADSDCLLAILAMTQQRSAAGLAQEVDAGVIPDGADAALLISSYLLLNDIILNALPVTFPGTTTADYTLPTTSPTLTLANPCQLSSIEYQGSSYQPMLQSFSVEFQGTQIVCQSQTSISVHDGVTAHTSVNAVQGLTLTTNGAGQPTLTFTEIGQPQIQHWTTTDPSTDSTDEAIGLGLTIAGIFASVFTGGLAGVFIAVTAVLIGGIVENLPELIADWTPDTAPSLDLMATNITGPFVWTGGAAFSVAAAVLADSVVLSGTPWPSQEAAS